MKDYSMEAIQISALGTALSEVAFEVGLTNDALAAKNEEISSSEIYKELLKSKPLKEIGANFKNGKYRNGSANQLEYFSERLTDNDIEERIEVGMTRFSSILHTVADVLKDPIALHNTLSDALGPFNAMLLENKESCDGVVATVIAQIATAYGREELGFDTCFEFAPTEVKHIVSVVGGIKPKLEHRPKLVA